MSSLSSRKLFPVSCLLLFFFSNSQADSTQKVGAFAGVGFNSPTASYSDVYGSGQNANAGIAGGLFYSRAITAHFDIEGDLNYALRSTSYYGGTTSRNAIEIPVFVRWNPIPLVSLGFGPYYAYNWGSEVNDSYDHRNEFGLAGSLRERFAIDEKWDALVDLRYLMGLTNMDRFDSDKERQFEILAGVSMSFE
jgi:hypothetical protein